MRDKMNKMRYEEQQERLHRQKQQMEAWIKQQELLQQEAANQISAYERWLHEREIKWQLFTKETAGFRVVTPVKSLHDFL